MRTIKFRGKVKYNGQHFFSGDFIEGYYAYKELDQKHIILVERPETTRYASYFVEIEVDAETVGQSTGLKDKNGVEIYEGDKLRLQPSHKKIHVVSWHNETLCFIFRYEDRPEEFYTAQLHNHRFMSEIEVIGNIHEVQDEQS